MRHGKRISIAAALVLGIASEAAAKTCEERFVAQGLSTTGLVANTPITFEGNEYFVRPGETPQGICAKADRRKSVLAAKDSEIESLKARLAKSDADAAHYKELSGTTNYFKRHVYFGWAGWPVAAMLVIVWTSVSVGIFIGKRGRR